MNPKKHVLITGGAGYIGSYLTGRLLKQGYAVTVIDDLLYGGDSLLAYLPDTNFYYQKSNLLEPRAIRAALRPDWSAPEAVVHLAGIAGFPACQAVGRRIAWRYNVEATQQVFDQVAEAGARRFIFVSTYHNYAMLPEGELATEEAPLNPQSLYAETMVAAERFLLCQDGLACSPLIFRSASVYGISPRTRFDLIFNQFILEAFQRKELLIYQRGYKRSFIHISDVADAILLGLKMGEDVIRGQVYNLGSDEGNCTKDQLVAMILKRLPETVVGYKDLSFGGDMRDLRVSFSKIRDKLGFRPRFALEDGIREILYALQDGLIKNPEEQRYRNAQFVVR